MVHLIICTKSCNFINVYFTKKIFFDFYYFYGKNTFIYLYLFKEDNSMHKNFKYHKSFHELIEKLQ